MQKHLLLIAHHNSYRIAPYLHAARDLGMAVTIASEGRHSLISEIAHGLHIDFQQPEQAQATLLEAHRRKPFHGVLGSDDQTVEIAANIARELGLVHNPPEAARITRRKDLARAQLSLAGCPVPIHCLLDFNLPLRKQLAGLPWPCVVKPLDMSGSRGVIRVDDETAFLAACERLRPIVAQSPDRFARRHALIEAYIEGEEIAYEGYLHRGKLTTLTLFDKPEPLTGPYFEETIYVTPSRLPGHRQDTVREVIQQACDAYGLVTGMVHAECRIDPDGRVWILEIASRTIGGDCARMLDSQQFRIEALAVSLAVDQPFHSTPPGTASGVMMLPVREKGLLKRVEGLLEARRIPGIDQVDIIIQPGHELIPLPEGNQYLGYLFASGESPEDVVCALQRAYGKLRIVTRPVFSIRR